MSLKKGIHQTIQLNTYPKTYLLEDLDGSPIQGGFCKELNKTRFPHTYLVEKVVRRKGNKFLVKP